MSKTQVDAFWIDLDSQAGQVDEWYDKLGRDDRAQAREYRVDRERIRFVVRRGWVRDLLSQRLAVPPRDIRISRNAFGKPCLPRCELCFNLSHSAGKALLVIAEALEIGCDVEQINRDMASVAIADRFFSAREKAWLFYLPREEWLQGFFNCWTRKEAYIKARGYGLSHPLASFDVSLTPNDEAQLLRGCEGWSVVSFQPISGFVAAVVANGTDWFLRFDGPVDRSSDKCQATCKTGPVATGKTGPPL